MKTFLIAGLSGLTRSEAWVPFRSERGHVVPGLDGNQRAVFFEP